MHLQVTTGTRHATENAPSVLSSLLIVRGDIRTLRVRAQVSLYMFCKTAQFDFSGR